MLETEKIVVIVSKFTNPIANFFHFLLSTPLGYTILGVILIYYIISEIDKGIFKRKIYKSGGHSGNSRLSLIEALFYGLQAIIKGLIKLGYKLAIIISIYLFLNLIVKFDKTLSATSDALIRQENNQQISCVAKQISRATNIAEINVDNVDYSNFPDIRTSLKIKYFDQIKQALREDVQQIDLAGGDMYIDIRQLNFEYSQISSPEKAVKFPTLIYSELVAKENGIKLKITDSIGIPYYLRKKESEIYGAKKEDYFMCVKKLFSWTVVSPETKLMGIRPFSLPPLHKKLMKSEVITLSIDAAGEIVLNSNWTGTSKPKQK